MASLLDMRRRIKSVKNTQQITKAMKMVAAAKLKRTQNRILAARPYALKMRETISNLSRRVNRDAHPLLRKREGAHRNVIVTVNDHFRGGTALLIPGGRLTAPLSQFQTAHGQKFSLSRQSPFRIEVTATTAAGTPVSLSWGQTRP